MCGICGYTGPPGDGTVLEGMIRCLAHRGPDATGSWCNERVSLGHTRLAIIDLTEAGNQPMTTPEGTYGVVFNGEIYNYREIRRELEEEGQAFRSRCDTEVILIGYRRWGRPILEKLRGMFAFGVWDDAHGELLLARDRVGVKPLFYAQAGDGIVFASEIKSLFRHPMIRPVVEAEAVDAYLTLGYVPGPQTVYKGILSVRPGHWVQWKRGKLREGRYWRPYTDSRHSRARNGELVDEFDSRLNDAVKSHLVADVPVGAFLSGGLDSSLVAAIAQRHMAEPLQTCTIGFAGGGDERAFARKVAVHVGTDHREQMVSVDLVEELPRLLWYLDQPLFDNSVLPTYLVSRFAAQSVKVVLSGDGGDEPFAGYDWTRYALMLPDVGRSGSPSGWSWAYEQGAAGWLRKLIHDVSHGADGRYLRRMCVSDNFREWLYQPDFLRQTARGTGRHRLEKALGACPAHDPRERFLHADLSVYLPEDVLFKVDRMSMANALEVRVPLLDHRLLEWVLALPLSLRFRHGRGKHLLRKVAARYLPPAVLKPRKQGFTVPMGRWLHGPLGTWVDELFGSRLFETRGFIRPGAARTLLEMHRSGRYELGHRIWSLVVLEVWARVWLDGAPSPKYDVLLAGGRRIP